ncbi:MAG: hypothetical protein QXL94_03935 [Candidatus Parvarchaeum sp.]
MANPEMHTAEEWKKKLGEDIKQLDTGPKLSKEEYIKMLKKQETAKELLTAGKNILNGITQRVGSAGKKFIVGLGNRLAANYDTAIGNPVFGTSIREILGTNQKLPSSFSMQNPYAMQNPYQRYVQQNPYAMQNLGPQYPKEIYSITPEMFATPAPDQQHIMPNMPQSQMAMQQPVNSSVPLSTSNNQIQASVAEPQVVFFFDKANDTVSEILSEFDSIPAAEAEVSRLRKQGLPAFYATKGNFVNVSNNNRLKA